MRKIMYYFLPLLVILFILISQAQVKADIILFQEILILKTGEATGAP